MSSSLSKTRFVWALACVAAFYAALALTGALVAMEMPGAPLLVVVAFAAPFGVGQLAARRHPCLSASGFGLGTTLGLVVGAFLVSGVHYLRPDEHLWILLTLPLAFAACVGTAYGGSGWSIPPAGEEVVAALENDGEEGLHGDAMSLTEAGVERLLSFERRSAIGVSGVTLAVLIVVFGRTGLIDQSPGSGALVLGVVSIAVVFSQRRQFRRRKAAWESLRIAFDGDTLSRHIDGQPDLTIPLREVTRLQEGSLGLAVRGRDRRSAIFVPAGLRGYDALRLQLAAARQIEPMNTTFRYVGSLLILLLVCAGVFGFLFSNAAGVVLPLGVLLLALMIWSFVELSRSRLVDWKQKRLRWLVLPVIVFILGKIIVVLLRSSPL